MKVLGTTPKKYPPTMHKWLLERGAKKGVFKKRFAFYPQGNIFFLLTTYNLKSYYIQGDLFQWLQHKDMKEVG